MRKNLINKVKNNTHNQLYLFSGHDTVRKFVLSICFKVNKFLHDYIKYVAGLVKLLNLTGINNPPYASAVVLELHQEIHANNYFVQVYYKNNSAEEPINYQLMTIYGCENLCPFNQFLEIISNLIVDDYKTACKLK